MAIKLSMLFALGAVSAASKTHWKLTSEDNNIYSGDIKFQMTLSQSWECAKACNKYGDFCLAFGFVPSTGICYGYGETTEPEYVTGAQLWSRFCSLPGYHLEPALGKCIKFYTNILPWINASKECQEDGASLLRLDKQEPVDGWRQYGDDEYFWIGGRKLGVGKDRDWKWENGVTVKNRQWDSLCQPHEECMDIGIWDDLRRLCTYTCEEKQAYICQE